MLIKTEHLNVMYTKTKELWEIVDSNFEGLEQIDFYNTGITEITNAAYGCTSLSKNNLLEVKFDHDCMIIWIKLHKV